MPTPDEITEAFQRVVKWECLRSSPTTAKGWMGLAEAMAAMCPIEEMDWLCNKVLMGCQFCPTPLELRRICTASGHRSIVPKDGLEVDDVEIS